MNMFIALILLFTVLGLIIINLLKRKSKIKRKKSSKDKGEYFEKVIFEKIKKILPIQATVYNGVYLKNKKTGYTNEFDIIVLSKKGLIVLELKSWEGDIYPGKDEWKIFINKKEIKRYSPIKQNESKIKNLILSLEIKNRKSVISLIGFDKTYNSLNINNEKVKSGQDIIDKVNKLISTGDDLFTDYEYNRLKTILDYLRDNTSLSIKRKHINDIKKFKK